MTNSQYIRNCSDDELAIIFASIVLGIAQQMDMEVTEEAHEHTIQNFRKWLDDARVEGEHLN